MDAIRIRNVLLGIIVGCTVMALLTGFSIRRSLGDPQRVLSLITVIVTSWAAASLSRRGAVEELHVRIYPWWACRIGLAALIIMTLMFGGGIAWAVENVEQVRMIQQHLSFWPAFFLYIACILGWTVFMDYPVRRYPIRRYPVRRYGGNRLPDPPDPYAQPPLDAPPDRSQEGEATPPKFRPLEEVIDDIH